jgi:hypothetical protein
MATWTAPRSLMPARAWPGSAHTAAVRPPNRPARDFRSPARRQEPLQRPDLQVVLPSHHRDLARGSPLGGACPHLAP